jgi:hypothetical protein
MRSPQRGLFIAMIAGLTIAAVSCGSDSDAGEDSGFRRTTSTPEPTREETGTPTPSPVRSTLPPSRA